MRPLGAIAAAALALGLFACDGLFTPYRDAGSDGGGCAEITCPPGQRCVDGACRAEDPCDGVICPDPREVCQGGVCVPDDADADGDGYLARVDCDDADEDVHPGADEVCNGVDDDCDAATEDGADDCPGRCCGGPATCRDCCDASACGPGGWTCEGWTCVCTGIVSGDECITDGDCTPGEEDTETGECGLCGSRTRTRTCSADGSWGAWSDWSDCTGEGVCSRGATDTDTDECGCCGTESRSRTCQDDCTWGSWSSWSSCSGEGVCCEGATDTETGGCGCTGTQTRTRTCTSSCAWGAWGSWSSCTGDRYCTSTVDGSHVCEGGIELRPCTTGDRICHCTSTLTWDCEPGCV